MFSSRFRPLPEDSIIALNTAFEACDQKTEVIPGKLAVAKPGDKLYEGLVQKVKKVCSLDEQAWAGKLRATLG